MYQFFVEDEQVQQDRICIVGGDVNHIGHVLRMKTGEKSASAIRAADRILPYSGNYRGRGLGTDRGYR